MVTKESRGLSAYSYVLAFSFVITMSNFGTVFAFVFEGFSANWPLFYAYSMLDILN